MTIIVEDGTIVAGANSFVTLAEADTYLAANAQAATWAGKSQDEREALLVNAGRQLNALPIWKGSKADLDQPMSWPRVAVPFNLPPSPFRVTMRQGVYPESTVPPEVKQAQMELAAVGLSRDAGAEWDGAGMKKLGLGDGALEIEFDAASAPSAFPPAVSSLLRDFTTGGSGNRRMVRAYRA